MARLGQRRRLGSVPVRGFGALLIYTLFGWFSEAASESEGGLYNQRVDTSYRWSMSWFIFSEVMFFAAFFGALYYARVDHDAVARRPGPQAVPVAGLRRHLAERRARPAPVEPFQTIGPWPIPTINTALLLASGRHADDRAPCAEGQPPHAGRSSGCSLTIALGVLFMALQAYEYMHAYRDLNLKLTSGIFGSTFFMLTGFHGFHVTVGAIMLSVVLARVIKGHFTRRAPLRFRGRRLVLALRRRGLAAALRGGLLGLEESSCRDVRREGAAIGREADAAVRPVSWRRAAGDRDALAGTDSAGRSDSPRLLVAKRPTGS